MKSAKECLSRLDAIGRRLSLSGEKAKASVKSNLRLNIALTGVGRGTGTTFAGLSIACFFADKGYKTIFADYCQSGDLNRLEKIFNHMGRLVQASEKSYLADGIMFAKDYNEIANLPRRDFGTVIGDFGCQRHEKALAEFNRADIKLVVCPAVDWKIDLVREFREGLVEFDPYGEWIYLFPQARLSDEKSIMDTLQIKNVLVFPFIQNPFHQSVSERRGIGEALKAAMELSGVNIALK